VNCPQEINKDVLYGLEAVLHEVTEPIPTADMPFVGLETMGIGGVKRKKNIAACS
jgi:hypothetical protein